MVEVVLAEEVIVEELVVEVVLAEEVVVKELVVEELVVAELVVEVALCYILIFMFTGVILLLRYKLCTQLLAFTYRGFRKRSLSALGGCCRAPPPCCAIWRAACLNTNNVPLALIRIISSN